MPLTVEQLVARVSIGDETAFRKLVHRCQPMLRALARARYAPGFDHDDYDQVALLALWEACRTYDALLGVPFGAFAELMVRRRVDDATKTATRAKRGDGVPPRSLDGPAFLDGEAVPLHETVAARHHSAFDQLELRDTIRIIVAALTSRLTRLEREAILGWAFLGESYAETEARILAFDGARPGRALYDEVKVVDNALARARRKLRLALDEEQAA